MDELPLHVVEVSGRDIDEARAALHQLREMRSLAQLGLRLHVLIDQGVQDPASAVRDVLARAGVEAEVRATKASLEDVFVAATLPGNASQGRAA